MNEITVHALTKSAKLNYCIVFYEIHPEEAFIFINKRKFDTLCKYGCTNYGFKWSCPPYAPSFSSFVTGFRYLYVMFFYTDMAQYSYIDNNYLKIKAANSILKSRADRFLCTISPKYGRHISAGSCRLCKPCKRKLDERCAKPEKMTYSYEALGIDVNQLVENCFQKSLQWYKPRCLPAYTSVVCGLLTNETIKIEELQIKYSEIILD